ncbi:hypothetical protein BKA66DRAFT_425444 [Pyrenochaeta sp. MPI-SDFR-AT-0127]|nr:hypothetical protein BKA66DRAFT_425444 [Pyrenochaeta sp. MPI-SDFR-AT-0127]
MKRSWDKSDNADIKDITTALNNKGAVAVMLYNSSPPNPEANDIWPECRSSVKLPSRYFLLDRNSQEAPEGKSKRRPSKSLRKAANMPIRPDGTTEPQSHSLRGRPEWKLPVELVELIAGYLNRDDIKALRLVGRELNYYVSQVIFKTVVVPFNTEIYGMLGQEPKPDFKGKRRAKIEKPGYSWKNTNGDEVYNGHGLDVFRGFGKHILKYGMSFEVSENSLAMPPVKSLTEQKTSFWGNYEWPFEEYRRFDAVAGLETAADETPRMKIAFSELTKVKELALSIDSGLGWLNGPDRSIRARVLQRPLQVFGTSKDVPDRRAQAQQELWSHVKACHQKAVSDVRLATLYRMDGQRPLFELKEASMLTQEQPEMPYLEPRLIHAATPHNTADIQVPTSFDDPEVLERFVLTPPFFGTGVLYTSTIPPADAAQLMSPIIPASLTKAQKEWLLETEWAQRAFLSSYMLSVIDNPFIFAPVHTLKISRLSDRYLPMLNRTDFWNNLPNLADVTLVVIPSWRTVQKDEAGFVDTPKINPSQGTDPFCDLLRNHIACRSNIHKLTIGWATGGEHAEGLHARNKLIMPAPLVALGVRADSGAAFTSAMLVENDANRLKASLLHLPHVKQFTLTNCWITPPALQQFVKIHDTYCLRSLVLNSVSLTAILRPNGNANQAGGQAAALNIGALPAAGLLGAGAFWNALNNNIGAQAAALQAQAQFLPNQQQFLQIYIQALQVQLQQLQANAGGIQQNQLTTLQNQLQQQAQQLQVQNPPHLQTQGQIPVQQTQQAQPQLNFNGVAMLATQMQHIAQQGTAVQPPPVSPNSQSVLKTQPREGSWINIIDHISPGTNLSDFDSEHSQAENDRTTSLQSVEFISCGYVKLPYAPFDQTLVDAGNGLAAALRNPAFTKRYSTLGPAMLSSKWAHLGEIVQEVDLTELAALDAGWNLKTGWADAEEASAVEFDGLLPGGTGRFTGVIRRSDRVTEATSAS